MDRPKVGIVVLNWNDGNATLACLRSLTATDYPNFEVIVVDNGSHDGSTRQIRLVARRNRAMLLASDRRPHGDSRSVSTTFWNHIKPGHSTHFETASEMIKCRRRDWDWYHFEMTHDRASVPRRLATWFDRPIADRKRSLCSYYLFGVRRL
jgi:glycosyltransferase involved in cell wall biosynthesis